jgi:aminoglycoside phosphotransferase (APT) family kinase protein
MSRECLAAPHRKMAESWTICLSAQPETEGASAGHRWPSGTLSVHRQHGCSSYGLSVWKPAVSDELLLQVASGWANRRITELEPLAEGEDSRAVAFSSDSRRVVLRVRRDGSGFPREVHARELLAPVGVTVPEVLAIGTVEDLAWCISARVDGRTAQELTPAEALAVGPVLVETWRAIASVSRPIEANRPGSFNDRPAETWELFLNRQDGEVNEAHDSLEGELGRDLFEGTRRVLAHRPSHMLERQLVQFDFGSNNVLVADGRVAAVIDWDYPGWGDPLWDVANLHAWRDWLPCMDIHAECFDRQLWDFPSYGERIRYYGAHIVLAAIRWELFINGDPKVRAALHSGLRRLLD